MQRIFIIRMAIWQREVHGNQEIYVTTTVYVVNELELVIEIEVANFYPANIYYPVKYSHILAQIFLELLNREVKVSNIVRNLFLFLNFYFIYLHF